ncbi:MAG: single-stranded DNA-binding protein [Candidatus Wallbacteria bacterium]|nr:single-stranded DNA-binding protein [Candidatus Wallbacteria bacterium]
MASLNRVMLIGNLTRDPEVRMLATGKQMTRLGMAVNRTWRDKEGQRREDVTFFNLTAFDRQAEMISKYARKGQRLFVDGRLQARTVTNDKGEARTFHDVRVRDYQFLDGTKDGAAKPGPDDSEDEGDEDTE